MSNLLTISYGDTELGPALLEAVLRIMAEAGSVLEIETVQLGYEMERLEFEHGFDKEGLNKIRRARILLMAPTINDVATPLRAALGEECLVFKAADLTPRAMTEAAVETLKLLEQDYAIGRIETALLNLSDASSDPDEFAAQIIAQFD